MASFKLKCIFRALQALNIAWNKSLEHLRESRGFRIVLKHMTLLFYLGEVHRFDSINFLGSYDLRMILRFDSVLPS